MRTLLVFSFHPAFYPPKSGGEHRLYHVYSRLSAGYRIKMITFTYPGTGVQRVEHNPNFTEIRVPKSRLNTVLHHVVNRTTGIRECSAVIASIDSWLNRDFRSAVRKEIGDADALIFSYPYLFTLPEKALAGRRVVYEAPNVEREMMGKSLTGPVGKLMLRYVGYLEGKAARRSDAIFCVSGQDAESISRGYGVDRGKIIISRNGVNVADWEGGAKRMAPGGKPTCIFIGSYHPPNIEAVEAIVSLAARAPDVCFIVAGSVGQYFIDRKPEALEVSGAELFPRRGRIAPGQGIRGVEQWATGPVRRTAPEFTIDVREAGEIRLKVSSRSRQYLVITHSGKTTTVKLVRGQNTISVTGIEHGDPATISFSCQKAFPPGRKGPGVALEEVAIVGDDPSKMDLGESSGRAYRFAAARNVVLAGEIGDGEKRELYAMADVALNPMLSGSGTNIKMLEYMAAGIPVVTTPTGARGLGIENGRHAVVCAVDEFPARIRQLALDEEMRAKLRAGGRTLVAEQYDWKRIAAAMAAVFRERWQL